MIKLKMNCYLLFGFCSIILDLLEDVCEPPRSWRCKKQVHFHLPSTQHSHLAHITILKIDVKLQKGFQSFFCYGTKFSHPIEKHILSQIAPADSKCNLLDTFLRAL